MSRDLTTGVETEATGQSLRPVFFYEGAFTGGTLRLWSGLGEISWSGQTWTGAGSLLGISPIQETTETRASGIKVSLSGHNTSLVSAALAQSRRGQAGKVWIGFLDGVGAVIADPYLAFEGKLDVPDFTKSGEQCVITISYESRLIDLERARERRITHEDLQIDFPGDLGRQYVAELQDKVIVW